MRHSLLALALLVVILLLGGAAFWLLGGDSGEEAVRSFSPTRAEDRELDASLATTALRADREEEETETEPVADAGPPPSYRAALGRVTGRILEQDLTPVPDLPVSAVQVKLTDWLLEAATLLDEVVPFPELEAGRTRTDEEGRFELVGLEPRAFQVLGIDLGGPRSTFRVMDQSPVSGQTVDLGDILLEPHVTFVGRVLDESSKPVPGARVRVVPGEVPTFVFHLGVQDVRRGTGVAGTFDEERRYIEVPAAIWNFEPLLPIPTTYTDAEGSFRLPGVPLGMTTVLADKEEHLAAVLPGFPSGRQPERSAGDLYLRQGDVVEGILLGGDGEPLVGAQVKAGVRPLAMPIPAAFMQPSADTDAEGRFRVTGLPQGPECLVAARRRPSEPWSLFGPFDHPAGALKLRFEVEEELQIRLRHEDGSVVPRAELYLSAEHAIPFLPPVLSPPMQRLRSAELVEDGLYRAGGIAPGRYKLCGRAPDLALASAEVEVLAEQSALAELVFRPAYTLEVKVKESGGGGPLAFSFVTISPAGLFEEPVDRGRTRDDGTVLLESLQAGSYSVTAQHPARASAIQDVEVPREGPLVIELGTGGHLKGIVHRSGEPPNSSTFVLAFPEEREFKITSTPSTALVSSDGSFGIPNMEVGSYGYQVRDRLAGEGPMSLIVTMQDDPLASGSFEIREGEVTELEIDISGRGDGPIAFLSGEIWINGEPADRYTVRFEGDRTKSAETDERGMFDLEAVSAGEGQIQVLNLKSGGLLSFASPVYDAELTLVPGESRHLDLRLRTCSVSGRVFGPEGLPTGFQTFVLLSQKDGSANRFTTPNPLTGGYSFDDVVEGEYTLSVRKEGCAPYSEDVLLDAARGDVVLNVDLHLPVSVSGVLVLPEGVSLAGEPVEGERRRRNRAWALLVDGDERPSGRARVDAETLEFRVDDAAPGAYRLKLMQGGEAWVSEPFDVPPDGLSGVLLTLRAEQDAATEVELPETTSRGG